VFHSVIRLWPLLLLGCTGEPLKPVEDAGEGDSEPPCTDSLCLQFAVTGGQGFWWNTNTTATRGDELIVYSACIDGTATLTSTNGSTAISEDCRSIMSTVTTSGQLSSPRQLDAYQVTWAVADDARYVGFTGITGAANTESIYVRFDGDNNEVVRHRSAILWLASRGS
jgi:hypothetical protein